MKSASVLKDVDDVIACGWSKFQTIHSKMDWDDSDIIAASDESDIFNKSTQPIFDAETQMFSLADDAGEEEISIIPPTPSQRQVVHESFVIEESRLSANGQYQDEEDPLGEETQPVSSPSASHLPTSASQPRAKHLSGSSSCSNISATQPLLIGSQVVRRLIESMETSQQVDEEQPESGEELENSVISINPTQPTNQDPIELVDITTQDSPVVHSPGGVGSPKVETSEERPGSATSSAGNISPTQPLKVPHQDIEDPGAAQSPDRLDGGKRRVGSSASESGNVTPTQPLLVSCENSTDMFSQEAPAANTPIDPINSGSHGSTNGGERSPGSPSSRSVSPTQLLPCPDSSDMVLSSQDHIGSSTPAPGAGHWPENSNGGDVTPTQPLRSRGGDSDADRTPPVSPVMDLSWSSSSDPLDSVTEEPSVGATPCSAKPNSSWNRSSCLEEAETQPISPDILAAASPDGGRAGHDSDVSTVQMNEDDDEADRQSPVLDFDDDSSPVPETQSPVFSYHEPGSKRGDESQGSPAKRRRIIRRSQQGECSPAEDHHRTSTPAIPSIEEADGAECETGGESDFELTFASHYSTARPSSSSNGDSGPSADSFPPRSRARRGKARPLSPSQEPTQPMDPLEYQSSEPDQATQTSNREKESTETKPLQLSPSQEPTQPWEGLEDEVAGTNELRRNQTEAGPLSPSQEPTQPVEPMEVQETVTVGPAPVSNPIDEEPTQPVELMEHQPAESEPIPPALVQREDPGGEQPTEPRVEQEAEPRASPPPAAEPPTRRSSRRPKASTKLNPAEYHLGKTVEPERPSSDAGGTRGTRNRQPAKSSGDQDGARAAGSNKSEADPVETGQPHARAASRPGRRGKVKEEEPVKTEDGDRPVSKDVQQPEASGREEKSLPVNQEGSVEQTPSNSEAGRKKKGEPPPPVSPATIPRARRPGRPKKNGTVKMEGGPSAAQSPAEPSIQPQSSPAVSSPAESDGSSTVGRTRLARKKTAVDCRSESANPSPLMGRRPAKQRKEEETASPSGLNGGEAASSPSVAQPKVRTRASRIKTEEEGVFTEPSPSPPPTRLPPRSRASRKPLGESPPVAKSPLAIASRKSTRSTSSLDETLSNSSSHTNAEDEPTVRRRRRALAKPVRVMFTCVADMPDHVTSIVVDLGGEIVDTPRDASVLVADRIRRTVKFLCAVGLGIPIVTVDWLVKSQITGSFQNPWDHLLKDAEGESQHGFRLADSLQKASESPLLSGITFHSTPDAKPPPADMAEIITSSSGRFEEDPTSSEVQLVISSDSQRDRKKWDGWAKRKMVVIRAEAVLAGVLRQEFEPTKYTY